MPNEQATARPWELATLIANDLGAAEMLAGPTIDAIPVIARRLPAVSSHDALVKKVRALAANMRLSPCLRDDCGHTVCDERRAAAKAIDAILDGEARRG